MHVLHRSVETETDLRQSSKIQWKFVTTGPLLLLTNPHFQTFAKLDKNPESSLARFKHFVHDPDQNLLYEGGVAPKITPAWVLLRIYTIKSLSSQR